MLQEVASFSKRHFSLTLEVHIPLFYNVFLFISISSDGSKHIKQQIYTFIFIALSLGALPRIIGLLLYL